MNVLPVHAAPTSVVLPERWSSSGVGKPAQMSKTSKPCPNLLSRRLTLQKSHPLAISGRERNRLVSVTYLFLAPSSPASPSAVVALIDYRTCLGGIKPPKDFVMSHSNSSTLLFGRRDDDDAQPLLHDFGTCWTSIRRY